MSNHQAHDDLRRMLDHPPLDAEPPRNPVLTHQVMERVRQSHAHAHAQSRSRAADVRPWILAGVLVSALALLVPGSGVLGDGGLSEAASLFDAELVVELVVGALIAAGVLALTWRRLV